MISEIESNSFKVLSPEKIGQLNLNAKARYWMSFRWWSSISFAFGKKSENSEFGTIVICSMDNSVVCMTYFQNYPDRKFRTRCHITNRIFYNKNSMVSSNSDSDIENCKINRTYAMQFSIWKTATIGAINHAIIHNLVLLKNSSLCFASSSNMKSGDIKSNLENI